MSATTLVLGAGVHGSLLLLGALLVVRLVPGLSAADRHAVLMAALIGQLVLVCAFIAPLATWHVPGQERLPDVLRDVLLQDVRGDGSGYSAASGAADDLGRAGGSSALLVLWSLGALSLSWRVAMGHVWARGVVARARRCPAEMLPAGLEGSVRLLLSDEVRVPFTYGLVRRVVILPGASVGWSRGRLEVVLLHELEHVYRRDPGWGTAVGLLRAIFWPNPLVWWVARRIRTEAEMAADDAVLRSGVDGGSYVHDLVDFVRSGRGLMPDVVPALTSRFETRVTALLNRDSRRGRLKVTRVGPLTAALLGIVLLMTTASATDSPAWARVSRDRIQLLPGAVVEIEGRGALHFVDGRSAIRLGPDLGVEGVSKSGDVLPTERLILVGAGGAEWVLRAIRRIPTGPGSRITDSDGSGTAAAESERRTRFFVEVMEAGRTVFFHPATK